MTDMEKVVNGLRCIKGDLIICVDCAYSDGDGHGTYSCKAFCANDAIAMLNEQNEEIENLKQTCQSMMEGVCLLKEEGR